MISGRFLVQWLMALLLLGFVLPLVAEAARFKVGDAVQIFDDWEDKWVDGTVIQTERRQVLIEYEWRGRLTRKVFQDAAVRYAYEADSLAPSRQWVDATGTFKITAAPLGIQDNILRLRREDMSEVEVPIDKLGDADRRYIDRLKKELGAKILSIPERPPAERFSGLDDFGSTEFGAAFDPQVGRIALLPDPRPAYLKLPVGGTAFGKEYAKEQFGLILPIGGPDGLVLASTESPEDAADDQAQPTRLVWVSLADQKVVKEQRLPKKERAIDYHPPSRRLLTYHNSGGPRERRTVLSIWEVMPTDDLAKPLISWEAFPDEPDNREPWARLIDGRIVLQRFQDKEYIGWDIIEKAVAYRLKQEDSSQIPILSGGKRYGLLLEKDSVRIFDPLSGSTLTTLATGDSILQVALSEDGTKLAALDSNSLTVWDLQDPQAEPQKFQAEALTQFAVTAMDWVNPNQIMIDRRNELILYDLPKRMAAWNYRFDHGTYNGTIERRPLHIVNGHLCYGASVSDDNRNQGLAVGNVKLPGPQVMEELASFDRETLEAVSPGDKVRLEVRCGDKYNHQVYTAMVQKIQDAGWVLSQEDAEIVIHADITQGDSINRTYHFYGRRPEETINYRPYFSTVTVVKDDMVLWKDRTSTGPGYHTQISADESMQQHVDRMGPDAGFFSRVRFAPNLLDQKYSRGLGTTQVTTRGLEAGELKEDRVISRIRSRMNERRPARD